MNTLLKLFGAATLLVPASVYLLRKPIARLAFAGNVVGPGPQEMTEKELQDNLKGKTYLIVGGTKGIGAAAAKALATRGCNVIIAGRTKNEELLKSPLISFIQADLTTVEDAKLFAAKIPIDKVDSIVFSNGIISTPNLSLTSDGIELDFAVSYLSRFVILQELNAAGFGKNKSEKSRVFVIGFPGGDNTSGQLDDVNWQTTPYNQMTCHMNTVLANEALVSSLSKKFSHLNVFGLSPGLITTDIRTNFLGKGFMYNVVEGIVGALFVSADQYAEKTLLKLFASKQMNENIPNGSLFNQFSEIIHGGKWVSQAENAEKIWKLSETLVKNAKSNR